MANKPLPFSESVIKSWVEHAQTPFYVYDEAGLQETARAINKAFSWVGEVSSAPYVNFFAVKATPTPMIMNLLKAEGMGFDASSGAEIELAQRCDAQPGDIMFSSNNTDPSEYREAYEAGALINLDDYNQINVLQRALDGEFPQFISFRYNPGSKKSSVVNSIIGSPEDAKFGVPDTQLSEAYKKVRELGATRFGIHTMLASNEVSTKAHLMTAQLLFEKSLQLRDELGIEVELVNLGGGLGIPYHPEEQSADVDELGEHVKQLYQDILLSKNLKPRLVTEYGRFVTGPHGYLITKVRSIKETFHRFVGVDATMANLMRPGMYDAYHHISVIDSGGRKLKPQAVVGSLCENNDFFTGNITMERDLPLMQAGDIVVIHDAGAHGHAMGFNYNGKLRSAEYLAKGGGRLELIRRAETRKDLFATLDGV